MRLTMFRPFKLVAKYSLPLLLIVNNAVAYSSEVRREVFYVGGRYTEITVGNVTSKYMLGQIYVEKLTPSTVSQKLPIVFIHGAGQTGTNWLETPDGRPGWASFFLGAGYVIYLSDQPMRGRSAWNPSIGSMFAFSISAVESSFTDTENQGFWPQAKLHTQWPGTGKVGDPIFDAFYAAQIQFQTAIVISEAQNAHAYAALLDKIGAAHVITHSQAGPYGWRIGDMRTQLVNSIVALEPGDAPFVPQFLNPGPGPGWGITYEEIAYEPTAGPNGTLLATVTVPSDDPNKQECILQAEPAKKLKNLSQIPILVVTGEASFHAPYDYCTVAYLKQAGVDVEHADLGEEGIHGNGHMFFLEQNSAEIAERVLNWIQSL
ncbi:Alpha/Beta hydrolase protein [Paraphoma chrysanthemicola]|uniref:Alpha/Beta hydrolase protein n=1 Tax=Paraphoma chrysanthemicola TaxID=798071 RepID=A0A8K0W2T6_9PLEO|nr:Alpha/Beta hydrolase protein [Paraphoma chrysanthemicola]